MTPSLLTIAGCMGCGSIQEQLPACAHVGSPWARLDTGERLGICSACGSLGWARRWDAAALEADQVIRGLKDLPPLPNTLPPDAEKIAQRINGRIRWFALNNRPEKPA